MKSKNTLSLSLSLSRSPLPRTIIACTLVFLLCLCTGILSGTLLRDNQKPAEAASANITVVDNDQLVNIDQSNNISTIIRTSTVTIKDTTATLGYKLSAKVPQNTMTGSTISIYPTTTPASPNTSPCTETSPCTLTTDTPTTIYEAADTAATTAGGHTAEFTITITATTNTPLGNYIVDIIYTEDPKYPKQCPVIAGKTYLQDIAPGTLSTHGVDRERVVLKDRRNNQDYYVQNIVNQDGSCIAWMETNLRYTGDGNWDANWGYPDDRYATTATNNTTIQNDNSRPLTIRSSGMATYNSAEYMNPGGSTDYTNTTANGGFYGYLYNWCAAMGGQADACQNNSVQPDQSVSICPAGWRLPTGGAGATDFSKLNTIINVGSITSDAGLRNTFLAVYSGSYGNGLFAQDSHGYYWSSTTDAADSVYILDFYASLTYPGTAGGNKQLHGFAVRCVL